MPDALAASRSVYEQLVAMTGGEPALAMRAWNGDLWGPPDASATIVLKHPGALRALLLPPSDLTAGEAYIYDDIDIEGSIMEVLRFGAKLQSMPGKKLTSLRMLRHLRTLPSKNRRSTHTRPKQKGRLHSRKRDQTSVGSQYNTGNDFFRLFLDAGMVYSSAAFLHPDETLESAQRRKIDLICRKLQLQPGQRLLDIGCGWGTLAIHAAKHYGVEVRGVTLSPPQVEWATAAAEEAGVSDRVTVELLDYRDIEDRYDAISSVGMFEHVGKGDLAKYFSRARDLLEPEGTFLNHGIVNRDRHPGRRTPTFINTYVFPDSDLVTVDEVIALAEDAGFELRDAESLRTSYAITLRHWVESLETNHQGAVDAVDEVTYRIFRIYMAGSAVAFDAGAVSVYQLLLNTVDRSWTYGRHHLLSADDRGQAAGATSHQSPVTSHQSPVSN